MLLQKPVNTYIKDYGFPRYTQRTVDDPKSFKKVIVDKSIQKRISIDTNNSTPNKQESNTAGVTQRLTQF